MTPAAQAEAYYSEEERERIARAKKPMGHVRD